MNCSLCYFALHSVYFDHVVKDLALFSFKTRSGGENMPVTQASEVCYNDDYGDDNSHNLFCHCCFL